MNWILKYFQSSIGKKQLMAVSGLMLAAFLVIHLIGNIPLFYPIFGGREHAQHALNLYAAFLQYKKIVLYGFEAAMIGLFGIHALLAFITRMENTKARGPRGYEVNALKGNVRMNNFWMLISGVVILAFLLFHIPTFKYDAMGIIGKQDFKGQTIEEYDYVPAAMVADFGGDAAKAKEAWEDKAHLTDAQVTNGQEVTPQLATWKVHNLYGKVEYLFHQWWYALIYLVAMVFLAVHLGHAVTSSLQTLGVNHPRFNLLAKLSGLGYTLAIAGGNIAITASMYLSQFIQCH